MAHVALTSDLLSWKWCMTHHTLMGCTKLLVPHMKQISPIGTEPWSRNGKNGHGKNFEWPVWPQPSTFWHENGTQPIITLLDVFVPDMKQIHQIGMEPRSGHDKNFEQPLWPWPLTFWSENIHATSIWWDECPVYVSWRLMIGLW